MKRVFRTIVYAISLSLVLTSCGLAPAKFDRTEQLGWASLKQKARQLGEACGDVAKVRAAVAGLQESSELLQSYLEYQADNGSIEIMGRYRDLLAKFRPDGGIVYCRDSAVNLQDAAIRAMKTNGGRER